MGMNVTIYMSRDNPANGQDFETLEITNPTCTIWNDCQMADYNKFYEVYKAHKFWDLYYALPTKPANGAILKLTYDDIIILRQCAIQRRDYYNTFKTVNELCEITDKFKEWEEAGFSFWFCCVW